MTLSDIRTEVFRRLDESETSPVYWSLADVDDAINAGYEEISDATEWYELAAQLGTDGSLYYDLTTQLSPRFLRLKHIYNATSNLWLSFTTPRDMDGKYVSWETVSGEPEKALLRGLWWLGLWPKPGLIVPVDYRMRIDEFGPFPSGSGLDEAERMRFVTVGFGRASAGIKGLYAFYAALPPPLNDANNTPGFPADFHEALVYYAMYELMCQEREYKKALVFWQQYLVLQERLRLYVQARSGYDRAAGSRES